MGFSVESYVIYYLESFVLRSVEFNVIFDLWGGVILVVEISIRFEGLEIIWEKFFGYKGYFFDSYILGFMKILEKSENEVREI